MTPDELKKRTKQFGLRCIQVTETLPKYWLEVIIEAELIPENRLSNLLKEGNELVAILTASSQTAKRSLRSSISNQKSKINNPL